MLRRPRSRGCFLLGSALVFLMGGSLLPFAVSVRPWLPVVGFFAEEPRFAIPPLPEEARGRGPERSPVPLLSFLVNLLSDGIGEGLEPVARLADACWPRPDIRPGMTKQQVYQLLGEPSQTEFEWEEWFYGLRWTTVTFRVTDPMRVSEVGYLHVRLDEFLRDRLYRLRHFRGHGTGVGSSVTGGI